MTSARIIVPSQITLAPAATNRLTGTDAIVIDDGDAADTTFVVTLSISTGQFDHAGLSQPNTTVDDGGTVATISGSLEAVNEALQARSIARTVPGTGTLGITVSANGGPAVSRVVAIVTPAAITAAPAIVIPSATVTAANGLAVAIPGVAITDVAAAQSGATDTVTVSISGGTLLAKGAGGSSVATTTGGSGTGKLLLRGTVDQLNADLATLAVVGDGKTDGATITVDVVGATGSSQRSFGVGGAAGPAGATAAWGGASGAYGQAANWNSDAVPGAGDLVSFLPGTYAVAGAGAAGRIDVTGHLTLTGALVTLGRSGTSIDVDSDGSLAIAGGAALTADDQTFIGATSDGALILGSAGSSESAGLSTTSLLLGLNAGSSGTMLLDDALWLNGSTVIVGSSGEGRLAIADRSSVVIGAPGSRNGLLEVAAATGSTGLVSVNGYQSTFTVNGDTIVGGTAAGAGGTGILLLDAAAATITGALTVQSGSFAQVYSHLTAGSVTVAAGATLTGIGRLTSGGSTNNGTIQALPNGIYSQSLAIDGAITGTGTLMIDDNATLKLMGAAGAGQTIVFGTNGTLVLNSLAAAGGTRATIAGFGAGDLITFTSSLRSVTYDPKTGAMTVTDSSGSRFSLALAGTYGADDFVIESGKSVGLAAQPIGIAAPKSLRTVQGLTAALSIVIKDLDVGIATEAITLTAAYGTFTSAFGAPSVKGAGTHQMTINGTPNAIVTFLAQTSYVAPNTANDPTGTDTVTIVASDGRGSGNVVIPVTITAGPATHGWSAEAGGAFGDGANWTDGIVPSLGDDVAFGAGFYTVTGPGSAAELTLSRAATATFTGAIVAGGPKGLVTAVDIDDGSRAVFAAGASLTARATVIVGDAGEGALQMAGGRLDIGNLTVGNQAGAAGTVTVDAPGTVTGNIDLGVAGIGQLHLYGQSPFVTGGASIGFSAASATLGAQAGATGTATISGATWNVQSLTVGDEGSGTIQVTPFIGTVASSGVSFSASGLTASDAVLGASVGGNGQIVLDHSEFGGLTLVVGQRGTGDIQLNASRVLLDDSVLIAQSANGTGSVEVSAGSTFQAATAISVGGATGGRATVTIGDGQGDSNLFGTSREMSIFGGSLVTLWNGPVRPGTTTTTSVTLNAATLHVAAGGRLEGAGQVVGLWSGFYAEANQTDPGAFALAAIDNAGTIDASGGRLLLYGNVTGGGTLDIAADAELDVQGAGAAGQTVRFEGTDARLTVDDLSDFASAITGFMPGDTIALPGVAETAATWSDDVLTVSGGNQSYTLNLKGDYAADVFQTTPDGAGGTIISVACYCRGTLIATAEGEKPVETLAIGERLLTAAGAHRPIKWIGTRSYAGRFANGNPAVLPIVFKAGSLGRDVPRRDLWVSPKHAMFVDAVLVPAELLVDGRTIVQVAQVERVDYFHIELDSHDVIVAEGALSETFVDDGSRAMFLNARSYAALYPDAMPVEAVYCAPRVEDGFALEAVRRRLAGGARRTGRSRFQGTLDRVDAHGVEGWAQCVDEPEVAVCLDILVDGVVVARTLAGHYRVDLEAASLGSGFHCFRHAWDRPLEGDHVVDVRRSSDGATLWCAPQRLEGSRRAA